LAIALLNISHPIDNCHIIQHPKSKMNEPLSIGGNEQQAVNTSTSPAILQRLHQRLLQPYGAINTQQLHCHADRTQTLTARLMQRSDLPTQIQSRYQLETTRSPEWVPRFNGQRTESSGGTHYEMVQRVISDDVGEMPTEFGRSQIQTVDSPAEMFRERAISSPPKVSPTAPSSIQRKETPTPEIPSTTARSERFRVSRRAISSTISQSASESPGTELSAETESIRAESSTPDTRIEPSQTPASTATSPISVQAKSEVSLDSGRQQATSSRQSEITDFVHLQENRDRTADVLPILKAAIPIQQPESPSQGKILRRSLSNLNQTSQLPAKSNAISQGIEILPTVKPTFSKTTLMPKRESFLTGEILQRSPSSSDSVPEISESPTPDRSSVSSLLRTESLPTVKISSTKITAASPSIEKSAVSPAIVQSKSLTPAPKSENREWGVSSEGNFSPPFVKPTLIQRQEDIAAPAEPATPAIPPAAPPAATPASSEVDVAEIAEQVSRILGRKMIVERERRGLNS
jgi:hypothetical protein